MELKRFDHYPVPSAVRCVTADLHWPWEMEWTLKDKDCISDRWQPPMSQTALNMRARRARQK